MTKITQSFTLDAEVFYNFRELCREKDIKMSTKIEELIRKYIGLEKK